MPERNQKVFYFSSPGNKKLIESLLTDESEVMNHSSSYLIEDSVLCRFMPKDPEYRRYAEILYGAPIDLPQRPVNNINRTISTIMTDYASAHNSDRIPIFISLILDYMIKNYDSYENPTKFFDVDRDTADLIPIFCNTISERLKKASIDGDSRLFDTITKKNCFSAWTAEDIKAILSCIKNYWGLLASVTDSYRLIASIAKNLPLVDNAEQRYKLLTILRDGDTKWHSSYRFAKEQKENA